MRNTPQHNYAVFAALSFVFGFAATAQAQTPKIGDPPEAKNMRLVGYHDLQARSAYHPVIQKQGDRYIAYVGHHGGTDDVAKPRNPVNGQQEFNGTTVLDVTDPKAPKFLIHIPGEEGLAEAGGAQMVRTCDGRSLPNADRSKIYMLRVFGNAGHEIWDVTKPEAPVRIAELPELKGTHKNFWECDTGIAFLVSGVPGWRVPRMSQVYDLSDPSKPKKIRDFGLDGQQPGTAGAIPMQLHGAISTGPQGNRVYLGYGVNKDGLLQIVDRKKLLEGPAAPTPENLLAPEVGRLAISRLTGAHTVFPMPKMAIDEFAADSDGKTRDFVMIVNESLVNECREARQMVWFADVTVESTPMIVSSWTVPEKSGNFCTRGGRFGAHSSNESMAPVFYKKLTMISWFNAGVRVLDIRNPFAPAEVGYFIPSITDKTEKRCVKIDGKDRCKVAIQTNNVETDDRGYIYIADRANTGLHILELTGEARAIAGLN